jgi:chitosanase
MITADQKRKIVQVVNVFETGSAEGAYDNISIFADGKGNSRQITYGRSQTTEQGILKNLIQMYIDNNGQFADQFRPFLPKIGKIPSVLVDNADFKKLLRDSARQDVVMRTTQDDFFDRLYYQPAEHTFQGLGMVFPLSLLVIYDSQIHSGGLPSFLRQRFSELPPSHGGDEKAWVKAYVKTRHEWLANHSRKILQKTVYRTQCFLNQIKNDNWMLDQVVIANGVRVS